MARNEEMERRCLNWARWRNGAGAGGLGYGGGGWNWSGADRGGYREAIVPTLDVEAEQTEQGLQTLTPYLRRTVEVYYLGTGTMEERCQQLQVSRATLYHRIDKAHEELAAWLREVDARAATERQRVERLQASVRPRIELPSKAARRRRRSSKD